MSITSDEIDYYKQRIANLQAVLPGLAAERDRLLAKHDALAAQYTALRADELYDIADVSEAKMALEKDPTNSALQAKYNEIKQYVDEATRSKHDLFSQLNEATYAYKAASAEWAEKEGSLREATIALARVDPGNSTPEAVKAAKDEDSLNAALSTPGTNSAPQITETETYTKKTSTTVTNTDENGTTTTVVTDEEGSVTTTTTAADGTVTTTTTSSKVTTSSEESSINEGASTRTDVDQSDPSKVPDNLSDEDTESEAVKASKTTSQSSAKAAQDKASTPTPAKAQWKDASDMRVTLRVPESYLIGPCAVLKNIGGILFPYTPEVSYDSKATYGSQQPLHSNFAQYFYQRSSVGPISITGKFSNQNQKDGTIYLGILHLLRSLIKMPWGSDANAGSPPPICRLDAFGDFMLNNVPVVVDSFKAEMPSTVDYISVSSPVFGNTMVPTITQINMTLNIVYSRQEMQNYSVEKWLKSGLNGTGLGGRGYL